MLPVWLWKSFIERGARWETEQMKQKMAEKYLIMYAGCEHLNMLRIFDKHQCVENGGQANLLKGNGGWPLPTTQLLRYCRRLQRHQTSCSCETNQHLKSTYKEKVFCWVLASLWAEFLDDISRTWLSSHSISYFSISNDSKALKCWNYINILFR